MKEKSIIRPFLFVIVFLVIGTCIKKEAHADFICVDPFNSICYATIQEGIDAASDGDTVAVASGTYIEQVTLKSGITLKGENRDTTFIWYNNDAVLAPNTKNTVVQGFTITSATGSGIYASNSYSQDRDLTIIGNKIIDSGIGIRFLTTGSVLRGNIWNNLIYGNTTAGISLESSNWRRLAPNIVNNVIFENLGDGIKTHDANASTNSTPFISNNIIMSNGNYGITNIEMTPTVSFNDVYANTAGDYDNVIIGPGNISVDPEFVDENNEDFHIMASSPVIDAGNSTNAPPDDIDSDVRPQGTNYDIGVDEFNSESPPPKCKCDLDNDGVCDGYDLLLFSKDWGKTDCSQ